MERLQLWEVQRSLGVGVLPLSDPATESVGYTRIDKTSIWQNCPYHFPGGEGGEGRTNSFVQSLAIVCNSYLQLVIRRYIFICLSNWGLLMVRMRRVMISNLKNLVYKYIFIGWFIPRTKQPRALHPQFLERSIPRPRTKIVHDSGKSQLQLRYVQIDSIDPISQHAGTWRWIGRATSWGHGFYSLEDT